MTLEVALGWALILTAAVPPLLTVGLVGRPWWLAWLARPRGEG